MMIAYAVTLLIGAFLGMRYRVLILAPAFIVSTALALFMSLAQSDSVWRVVLSLCLVLLSLQLGYLAGAMTRVAIAGEPVGKNAAPALRAAE